MDGGATLSQAAEALPDADAPSQPTPPRAANPKPSYGTVCSDDDEDAPSPTWVAIPSPVAPPLRCCSTATITAAAAAAPVASSTAASVWLSRPLPRQRRGRPPAKAARPVALSRVTVLSASVGGAPQLSAAAAGRPDDPAASAPRRLSRPPPLRAVAAAVDDEIDALEGAGWWECPPSPAALVRAASDDASADSTLCF